MELSGVCGRMGWECFDISANTVTGLTDSRQHWKPNGYGRLLAFQHQGKGPRGTVYHTKQSMDTESKPGTRDTRLHRSRFNRVNH